MRDYYFKDHNLARVCCDSKQSWHQEFAVEANCDEHSAARVHPSAHSVARVNCAYKHTDKIHLIRHKVMQEGKIFKDSDRDLSTHTICKSEQILIQN